MANKNQGDIWDLSDMEEDFPMPPLETYRLFHATSKGERTITIGGRMPEELVVQLDDLITEARIRGLSGLSNRSDVIKVALTFFVDSMGDHIGRSDSSLMFFTRQREIGRRSRDTAALSEIKRNVTMVLQGWVFLCDNNEFAECSVRMSTWIKDVVLSDTGLNQRLYLKTLSRNPVFNKVLGFMDKNNGLTLEIDECMELVKGVDKTGGVSRQ